MFDLLTKLVKILPACLFVTFCLATIALPAAALYRSMYMPAHHRKLGKDRAIVLYAKRLGRFLVARYGEGTTYAPEQVREILVEWGYSTRYDVYALAMYCDRDSFSEYCRKIGKTCDYNAMRRQIVRVLSLANIRFTPMEVMAAGADLADHWHYKTSHQSRKNYDRRDGNTPDIGHIDYVGFDGGGSYYSAGGGCDGGSYGGGGCDTGGGSGGGGYC
jgi:uncharacterized membrane protein YgcG